MEKDRYVSIGKIIGAHGIQGALKLALFTESTEFFHRNKKICVRYDDGSFSELTIDQIKPHKKGYILFFKGIGSIDQAKNLINAQLLVERAELPETESGVYYWVDLIGLAVFTTDGVYLGKLDSILRTGSNDVYVVSNKRSEVLIPALESVVKKIDLNEKIMQVQLPEGL